MKTKNFIYTNFFLLCSFVALTVQAHPNQIDEKQSRDNPETIAAPVEFVLYHNFTGYSFVEGHGKKAVLNRFTTLLVADGKVVATGDKGLMQVAAEARRVNLAGQTLLPGLIDAHGHILGLGKNLSEVDLRGLSSRTAAIAKVTNYADKNLDLAWVVGRGWNQVLWPDQSFPSRHDLDTVISDRPVWLTRIDGHAGWANSKALELAGITRDTPIPAGGDIVKDTNGEPTGVLIDTAMDLLTQHIPVLSDEQVSQYQQTAFQHLLSEGVTQVHDAGVSYQEVQSYRALALQKALQKTAQQTNKSIPMVRVHAMLSARDEQLPQLLAEGVFRSDNDFLQIRGVKLYGDGALGSRGAALLEPYTDASEQSGLLITPEAQVYEDFKTIIHHGFQVNYHAIGDYTNRLALDTFERLQQEEGHLLAEQRHRVEHAQIIHLDDIPRFVQLGILPSMQPTHATSDMNMAEERLGTERLQGAYAWRTFLDLGSIIPAGSDFPVELSNPFHGIHAAVTRQNQDNKPPEGWRPEQAMTVAEALRSFTIDAAWAGYLDDTTGSLEPGKWADFIVVDKDPFRINPDDLWRIKVLSTYVAGERLFYFKPE